jgi:dTDP-4-dehydrorhamnose 3,5-epimerase
MNRSERFTKGKIHDVTVRPLAKFLDERGWLAELFRSDGLPAEVLPVMAYISMTRPGVVRGPHEHAAQTDYFCFLGPGNFKLYLWDTRPGSSTCGVCQTICCGLDSPAAVIVPPGVVHAYRNISDENGIVFNAPNALYAGEGKASPVDEIRHEELTDSPFVID